MGDTANTIYFEQYVRIVVVVRFANTIDCAVCVESVKEPDSASTAGTSIVVKNAGVRPYVSTAGLGTFALVVVELHSASTKDTVARALSACLRPIYLMSFPSEFDRLSRETKAVDRSNILAAPSRPCDSISNSSSSSE